MSFNRERLKEILTQKKVSQRQLALRIGVAPQSVWEWLHEGEPSLEKFCKICEILDVEPNFLLGV